LSFGGGAHFCVGAHLARLELRSVFEELFSGFDEIAFESDRPVYRDRLVLRGLEFCRVTLRKANQSRTTSNDTVARRAPKTRVHSDRGMRPVSGSGEADIAWRSTLRSAVESSDSVVPTAPGQNLTQVSDLFARQAIFKACTPAELTELAATSYIVSFEPGDLLTAEGAESNECYVIDDGRAVVTIGRKGMGSMIEGDVVGERLRRVVETNAKAREWMQAEMQRRYPDAP
jgi:hypothetical protein